MDALLLQRMRSTLLRGRVTDPTLEQDHACQLVSQEEQERMVQPANKKIIFKFYF
jgi:hypothetical protein